MEDNSEIDYEVSIYHGTHVQKGTVVAKFSHSKIAQGIFADTETGVFQMIKIAEAHLQVCPQDHCAIAEMDVNKRALIEIQSEKLRRDLPLDAPRIDGPPILCVIAGGLEP